MSAVPQQSQESRSPEQWTVQRILEWTTAHLSKHGSESPRLDAEILLAHSRKCTRIELYTKFNEVLTDEQRGTMRELVQRRAKAEPVAYLVGHREFYGLPFRVTADVLIPRPDTETLVMELLSLAKSMESPRILDVGTGSGCIAVAIAANLKAARVTAVDLSDAALTIAKANAEANKVVDQITFLEGDGYSPLAADARFDFIVSNPPYVAEGELDQLQPDVRLHEPKMALVSGSDGLDLARRLIDEAPKHLVPGGGLLLEISPEQAKTVQNLMQAGDRYKNVRILKDLSGLPRVAAAQLASDS
ncbi:MAG: peptide chain release factor N(5)-glutamine methyltransferase [Planctomycetaceae bacterium]|nr:peptide chain release factor N(5)-glutamine methyltransferase [Planctomycetaceae bacterium]